MSKQKPEPPQQVVYQLLALDAAQHTQCEDTTALLHLMRGKSRLWKSPEINEDHDRIVEGTVSLSISNAQDTLEDVSADDLGRAFILTLTGTFEQVEPQREPIAAFLRELRFDVLYVLRDQASEFIACALYPHLYRIENALRGYLIRFMATRIGPKWWELTASSEMSNKAKIRRKNETTFGKHVDTSAYLIDFDELGEIVYEQSSGLLTREAIVQRLSQLSETPEAIRDLKREIQSNYQKLFKEAFADRDFKDKWKQFAMLRNKIAHNNLFTAEDKTTGEALAADLLDMIAAADKEAAKLVITTQEREAVQEQVAARTSNVREEELTETECLNALAEVQQRFEQRNMFVGLTYFLNNELIPHGHSYYQCRDVIDRLKTEGRIEIYHVPHQTTGRETAAIRILRGK